MQLTASGQPPPTSQCRAGVWGNQMVLSHLKQQDPNSQGKRGFGSPRLPANPGSCLMVGTREHWATKLQNPFVWKQQAYNDGYQEFFHPITHLCCRPIHAHHMVHSMGVQSSMGKQSNCKLHHQKSQQPLGEWGVRGKATEVSVLNVLCPC